MEKRFTIDDSKMVTRMVRHYDQEEREPDGSYHWDTVMPVLQKAFGKGGAQNFVRKYWIQIIQEGSSKKRVEFCVDHKNYLAHFRAVQGHSGGIPIVPELMGYTSFPYNCKECIFHRGCSWSVQYILASGLIPVGKESDPSTASNLLCTSEPFW